MKAFMENPQLAICIPTKDRPRLLRETLLSCINQEGIQNFELEICVADNSSGNASELIVEELRVGFGRIKYKRHIQDIGLDANMLYVAGMASAEYGVWLGDDDLLQPYAVAQIVEVIRKSRPDVMLLNADYCSADMLSRRGSSLSLIKDIIYENPSPFFREHWMHMPFGTLVIRLDRLQMSELTPFMGTFHAYSAYVFLYLNEICCSRGKCAAVVVSKPLVKLRNCEKTWKNSHIQIFYNHIPAWLLLLQKVPIYNQVAGKVREEYLRKLYAFRWLLNTRLNNCDVWSQVPPPAGFLRKLNYKIVSVFPIRAYGFVTRMRLRIKRYLKPRRKQPRHQTS